MFYVQLAPLGGIMSPLKSDLRAFWPFIYIKEIAQKGQNTPNSDLSGPKIPPQRCELDMKHVVLYVGHLYKPFWTKKMKGDL